jgi:hypothetical protein
MTDEADRLPEFPPDNELPASLELGPFVWRGADVGLTVTAFRVYSTGVAFILVTLSKGISLQGEDPLGSWAGERGPSWSRRERPAGSLRLTADGVPIISHGASNSACRLLVDAWAPFPPDGDLVFHLEWLAEGIDPSEFRVPRSAVAKALVLWPP